MISDGMDETLGRNEKLHISCSFKGHESDCPENCENCTIYLKTCGDELLAEGKIDQSIKLYKRALFVEPKFAEAWVNLGNAFGMKSEYNNALSCFNKAIAIDSVYGKAMLGKAITLRNLGRNAEALSTASSILEIYNNAKVREFKETVAVAGAPKPTPKYSLDDAIDLLTDIAYEISLKNKLLDSSGAVITVKEICQKASFSASVYRFCKRRYASYGKIKINSESILIAFYGSICITLSYFNDPKPLVGIDTYDYLVSHFDIEKIEDVVEKQLNIKSDKTACDSLWNLIYGYIQEALEIFERVTPAMDIEKAVLDATESAYIMGMMYAMQKKEQQTTGVPPLSVQVAFDKLVASAPNKCSGKRECTLSHGRIPPRHSIIQLSCAHCKRSVDHMVVDGQEHLLEKYQTLSREFTRLGFNATVHFYCSDCAKTLEKVNSFGMPENIVFSVALPTSKSPIESYPAYWAFKDIEYRTALAFLKGANTLDSLAKATASNLPPEEYIAHIRMVLGL